MKFIRVLKEDFDICVFNINQFLSLRMLSDEKGKKYYAEIKFKDYPSISWDATSEEKHDFLRFLENEDTLFTLKEYFWREEMKKEIEELPA